MGLRIRRADGAPAVNEYFARVPSSVITDRELSDGAARVYAAIRLWMIENANPNLCMCTMRDLGAMVGTQEREARKRVAELEARGHVVRERVRTIPGAPQGIRPLGQLRQPKNDASNRSKQTDCNRSKQTGDPAQANRPPGTDDPGNRHNHAGSHKKREKEENSESESGSSPAVVRLVTARPAPTEEETKDMKSLADALEELKNLPGVAEARRRREREEARGAKKGPGELSAKNPPRGESRDSIPDAIDCTGESGKTSRHERGTEHNLDYRTILPASTEGSSPTRLCPGAIH